MTTKQIQNLHWTKDEQLPIIQSDPKERILVEAGPGTGKIAVAYARVAKLLSQDDLHPGFILMVSFTQTALAEMKNRIRPWAESGRVSAVNFCSLDYVGAASAVENWA